MVEEKETYKQRYKRIKNSTEMQRISYTRRITGMLVLPLWVIFMPLAYMAESYFQVSNEISLVVAFMLTITIAALIAEKKADKKFNLNHDGEK